MLRSSLLGLKPRSFEPTAPRFELRAAAWRTCRAYLGNGGCMKDFKKISWASSFKVPSQALQASSFKIRAAGCGLANGPRTPGIRRMHAGLQEDQGLAKEPRAVPGRLQGHGDVPAR